MLKIELVDGRYGNKQAKVLTQSHDYIYLFEKQDNETDEQYKQKVLKEFESEEDEYTSRFELIEVENSLGIFEE